MDFSKTMYSVMGIHHHALVHNTETCRRTKVSSVLTEITKCSFQALVTYIEVDQYSSLQGGISQTWLTDALSHSLLQNMLTLTSRRGWGQP